MIKEHKKTTHKTFRRFKVSFSLMVFELYVVKRPFLSWYPVFLTILVHSLHLKQK